VLWMTMIGVGRSQQGLMKASDASLGETIWWRNLLVLSFRLVS
jgi:hypothetical protein